jgi:hypothetical protein
MTTIEGMKDYLIIEVLYTDGAFDYYGWKG